MQNQERLNEFENGVHPVPEGALEALHHEIDEAGGEWQGNPEDEGAVGWTAFDSASSDNATSTVLLPKEGILDLPHQSLVRIESRGDTGVYLGAVVKGPFAEPDGLRADAPIVVTATVRGKGNILMPNYHGRIQVELLGEQLLDGALVPPRRRPLPNSPVFPLDPGETAQVLRIEGALRLGLADSHDNLEVKVPIDKAVLPRHMGVLGTTGGGKSTTVSGIIARLQREGVACVFLDTEGEYTAVNRPTEDVHMLSALKRREIEPQGIENTHIYHLVGRDTANPHHPSKTSFRLDFSELSPYAVSEILELTDAQQTRFFQAYDSCKLLMREFGIFPQRGNQPDEQEVLELDEFESGYPRMTLSYLIDVVGIFRHAASNDTDDPQPYNKEFANNLSRAMQVAKATKPSSEISWRALLGKLWRLMRLQIFDTPRAQSIDYSELLQPGRVSIIDLSDTDSPQVNNLVIAQLLRGIQRKQDEAYEQAIRANRPPLQTVVCIEEAHEFLSRDRIAKMEVLFHQVARIARRGRKRWLGLMFITQLPQHLPDEVLGLINNWLLHKINDANVISRLRRSIGGINDGLWERLPALAPGQAVVSFTSLTRPLLVSIDPTPVKLLMVE